MTLIRLYHVTIKMIAINYEIRNCNLPEKPPPKPPAGRNFVNTLHRKIMRTLYEPLNV